jgi:hypothetical protein
MKAETMYYINLACIVVSTYLAARTESRFVIVLNTVAVLLNLRAVVVHLLIK